MIPLKEGLYSIVNINPDLNDTIEQLNYKNLQNKELQFCISNKEKIIRESEKMYTKQINSGKDLEKASGYMELSWQIGLTIGPTLIGVTFDYVGYSIPFIIIGSFSLIGVYCIYYYIYLADLEHYEKEISLALNNNNNEEEISLS